VSNGNVYRTSLNGNPIAGFPGLTANLRASYQREGISASLVAKFVGPFYTDNFKNVLNRNDAYSVLNFETVCTLVSIGSTELTLRGEVRNLFDRLYMQNGEGDAFFPAAERNYLLGIALQL
jgi:outer membrane receptor protein involved in Fe transport